MPFDTDEAGQASFTVVGSVHRLSALLLCLGLIAGNAAICAGWGATPEERIACCAEGGDCPMHKAGDTHRSASRRPLSQPQADTCCAASERQPSNPSTPGFVTVASSAVLGTGVVLPTPVPALVLSDGWRAVAPIPIAPVPRHVLLSVFLV